jgi:hypothetical protein
MSNADGWHRWFAWRPVRVYAENLGEETSQGTFPPRRPSRVIWWKWIERLRIVGDGDLIDDEWEYRERSDG